MALKKATDKFEKRFKYMEKRISTNGKSIESTSQEEMDGLWEEAKKKIG